MGHFPRKVKKWIVGNVEYDDTEEFDDEFDAEHSVEIYTEEVERWQCVDCDEVYEDKGEAYNCCG